MSKANAWSMRDLLRTAHPKPPTSAHDATFAWVCDKLDEYKVSSLPALLRSYRTMMDLPELTAAQRALRGIEFGLPRECLPTEALAEPEVWRALLPRTPPHALLRNLGVLTANGVLTNESKEVRDVAERLRNPLLMGRARVHPFAILLALLVYREGHGFRGSKTWTPITAIIDALEDAYDQAFGRTEPTNKRILIGIDISGSMNSRCNGTPVRASTAAAAMALTLGRAEPQAVVVQFDTSVTQIVPITTETRLGSLENTRGGGTDVAAPIRWAAGDTAPSWRFSYSEIPPSISPAHRQLFDAFVILTDSETWAGNGHPVQWLRRYREQVNANAKLVCCAMTANHASVVDSEDIMSFGCCGLDASLPNLVLDFIGR